jgi:hypothetical protein
MAVIVVSIAGCAGFGAKMNRLSINMQKDEVRALFGSNFMAKASKVDEKGSVLDLWEFYDKKTKSTYQIYFLNDKVSQWGKREDLNTFPELHAPTYAPGK